MRVHKKTQILSRVNLVPLYHTRVSSSVYYNKSLAIGTLMHSTLPLIQSTVGIFLTETACLRSYHVYYRPKNKELF